MITTEMSKVKDNKIEIYNNISCVDEMNSAVTVNVLTYNSSKYIVECLESIKEQSYPHIILQISDDSSIDNTIEVCRKWLENNNKRFIKCKIITANYNTGVSANFNRAWDVCETKYCKDIAGDDILLPNCISECMSYARRNPDIGVWFGKVEVFGCSDDVALNFISTYLLDYGYVNWNKETMIEYFLKYGNCLPAASSFINLEILKEKKIKHDERIPLLEDLPKWLNCLENNILFGYIDTDIVGYRMHNSSLSNGDISNRYNLSRSLYYIYYVYPQKQMKSNSWDVKKIVDKINYLHHYSIVHNESKFIRLCSQICDSLLACINILKYHKS